MSKAREATIHQLAMLGFDSQETAQLLRISATLDSWHQKECNGEVEIDGETGIAYYINQWDGSRAYRKPNTYQPAVKRVKALAKSHGLIAYIQPDPRGCALYIVRPSDVPEGKDVDNYYSRGIAVMPR